MMFAITKKKKAQYKRPVGRITQEEIKQNIGQKEKSNRKEKGQYRRDEPKNNSAGGATQRNGV